MRQYINQVIILVAVCIAPSCSNSDGPEYRVFIQPSAITADDAGGSSQSFAYDDYGRIVSWTEEWSWNEKVTARYSYPDANTVLIESEEIPNMRSYKEIVHLVNGRASHSDGTFVFKQNELTSEIRKTYRLEYGYDFANHLVSVKHSEVMGSGDDIPETAWNKPWVYENCLVWEGDNLVEFQDMLGKPDVYYTTRYKYVETTADYPVIMPVSVINSLHHVPLMMQGIFGSRPKDLISETAQYDRDGNIMLTNRYEYQIDDSHITGYYITRSYGPSALCPIFHNVTWTAR